MLTSAQAGFEHANAIIGTIDDEIDTSQQASSVVKLNQLACRQEVQILKLHVKTSMSDGNVMEQYSNR